MCATVDEFVAMFNTEYIIAELKASKFVRTVALQETRRLLQSSTIGRGQLEQLLRELECLDAISNIKDAIQMSKQEIPVPAPSPAVSTIPEEYDPTRHGSPEPCYVVMKSVRV